MDASAKSPDGAGEGANAEKSALFAALEVAAKGSSPSGIKASSTFDSVFFVCIDSNSEKPSADSVVVADAAKKAVCSLLSSFVLAGLSCLRRINSLSKGDDGKIDGNCGLAAG